MKITTKTGLLALEKGFRDPSHKGWEYYNKEDGGWFYTNVKGGLSRKEKTFQRVDQSVLQTWLRKKHKIQAYVLPVITNNGSKVYFYFQIINVFKYVSVGYNRTISSYDINEKMYDTYEKALERALQEGLKLIK